MRNFIVSLLVVGLAASVFGQTGGAIPVPGPTGDWKTPYVIFRNTSNTDSVVQKVGHRTFKNPCCDDIVVEPTITLAPGETRRVKNIEQNFDADWKQFGVDAHQLYILAIDPRVEATIFLTYGAFTKFEYSSAGPAGPRPYTMTGHTSFYWKITTDFSTPVGTYGIVLNMNPFNVGLVLRTYTQFVSGNFVDQQYTAPPGVSLFGINRFLPDGGTLQVCDGGCGVGTPGTSNPVYVTLTMGDSGGGTQALRYPYPPPSP